MASGAKGPAFESRRAYHSFQGLAAVEPAIQRLLTVEHVLKQIRKATRCRFSTEEKIRVVLEGLRGEIPITELCRWEGIQPSIYDKWSKAFLDAGKNGLTRDTQPASSGR